MQNPPLWHSGFIRPKDFADCLDQDPSHIESLLEGHSFPNLSYRAPAQSERDGITLEVLNKLDDTDLHPSGKNNPTRWNQGWGEILENLKNKEFNPGLLIPQYIYHDTLRWKGDYIKVFSRTFENDFYTVLRKIVFKKFLANASRVVEFGCGTGTSLLILNELFPKRSFVGCDWAIPSQEILKIINQCTNANIKEVRFNMLTLEGKDQVAIDGNTAVMTMHSMEQLGTLFSPMMKYLLEVRPKIIIHLEPIIELYDSNYLFDALAIKYHKKRNYLDGFLTALRKLQGEGAIDIMVEKRLYFGSMFHEGYSLIVWKPN